MNEDANSVRSSRAGRRLLRGTLVAAVFIAVLAVYFARATPDVPYSEQRFILDSSVTVTIHDRDKRRWVGSSSEGARYSDAAFDEMVRIGRLSDHRPVGSGLARLNAGDGSDYQRLMPEQKRMLDRALWMAERSDGAFDPTVGPLVDLWGVGERNHVPSEAELKEALARVGYEKVTPGADRGSGGSTGSSGSSDARSMKKPRDVAFDLGGASKGYAVQRGVEKLREMGVKSAIINAVSSTTVLGSKPDGKPWKVGVENPRADSGGPDLIAEIALPPGYSVSTSGDYQRYFEKGGRRYHHILDPETGRPAAGFIAVTVVTPESALDADLLSTAVFVLGPEKGRRLLRGFARTGAVWVTPDGKVSIVGPIGALVTSSAKSIKQGVE